ncbi:MAG: hypothetical protein LC796_06940 [Acidobacteria bacterium]|nr:hypothetical protein [Acidobacteriota bacterium]MCA1612232.1 hypothetical protein [Acidobacteriota bacterium]
MTATESPDPHDLISLLRSGEAAPEIRQFAARNLLPLEQLDQTRALLAVLGDPEVGETARETLRQTPPDSLAHFIREALPNATELDEVAQACDDPLVLEQLIRHPGVADGTLARLARTVTGGPQEALVINQVRLLRNPDLIDAFFENPDLSTDTRRRLLEIREEFFEKGKRKQAADEAKDEEDERLAAEIAAAEAEEVKVQALRAAGKDPGIVDLETSLTTGAAYRRIAVMTVSQKIKLAYSGGKEERRILMGDANKLVGAAVLKGRGLTVNEVESFCGMRHLDEDIFRKIAQNREWMRKPAIIAALVKNPKVNLAVTLPLIKRLHERDLKAVMRDPNLPEGVRISSRKILQERRK